MFTFGDVLKDKAARAEAANKPFMCLECGRRFTTKGAETATNHGCPNCGGSDIDLVRQ